MRTLIILAFILTSSLSVFGFAAPHTLSDQLKRSDTILRIVVVSYTELKSPDEFSFLAKCKIITKYKGGEKLRDYIYIPCGWNMDPDPSPLDAEGEYVVFLETLKSVSLGHPVTYDATHDIKKGKVDGMSLKEFEKIIEKLNQKVVKAEPTMAALNLIIKDDVFQKFAEDIVGFTIKGEIDKFKTITIFKGGENFLKKSILLLNTIKKSTITQAVYEVDIFEYNTGEKTKFSKTVIPIDGVLTVSYTYKGTEDNKLLSLKIEYGITKTKDGWRNVMPIDSK